MSPAGNYQSRIKRIRRFERGSSAVIRRALVTGRVSRRAKTYALGTVDDDTRKDQLGIGRVVLRPVTVERSHGETTYCDQLSDTNFDSRMASLDPGEGKREKGTDDCNPTITLLVTHSGCGR